MIYSSFHNLVGRRPEMLRTLLGEVALELETSNLGQLLRAGVWTEFESAWNALTIPQRAAA